MTIFGDSQAAGGRVDGAAGVGIKLRTDKPGSATVRPYFKWDWECELGASGPGGSASARGGLEVSVYRDGVLYQPSDKIPIKRTQPLVCDYTYNMFDGQHKYNYSDYGIAVDDISTSFQIEPGYEYEVNFGVWVTCDRSFALGGDSGSQARVDGSIPFIVVERLVYG